jgi:cell division protein FtsW (lipid II flippase)
MNFRRWIGRMPWSMVAVVLLLLVCGHCGIARGEELAGGGGRLLRRQLIWSALGVTAMLAVTVPHYRRLGRLSYALFAAVAVALVLVYFFPPVNGARRWIRFGGLGFQPSEFAKLAFVLMLARYLMYRDNFRRLRGLLAPLGLTMIPVVLILREPDLGTAALFPPILMLMVCAAGARRRDLALVALAGLMLLPALWTQMSREQRSRVTALFSQLTSDATPRGDGYHLRQAKQMLVLGGAWGSWLTGEVADDRTVYHVPEGATDSIFPIFGERYGLIGASGLLLAYVFLVWRGVLAAERTREPLGRLLATGVAALFAIQVVINTAMMVGLLPITGMSLPLVSYGGSGLLAHLLAVGLLMNVAMRPGYEVTDEPFRFAD